MASVTSDRLRNVALLSHTGAGKTILAEAMIHSAGASTRLGSVEDGTTASDYEPEEVRRGSSVQLSLLRCPWKDTELNLLDTPGYADFRGEVVSGVRVADAAVVVVSARDGVEVGTQQMWKVADQHSLPRLVFVSKMDQENADFPRVMDELTERFGRQCVPVCLPIGSQDGFSGVVNLMDPGSDVPDSLQAEVDEARERLTEAVAEADDDLATKYLEGEPLTTEEIKRGLRAGTASGTIVPVLAGASPSEFGIVELMDAIIDYLPSPADAPAASGTAGPDGEALDLECDSAGRLAALVFKTTADPFVGKLSYFRVYSGTLKSDSHLWDAAAGEAERVGQVFHVTGKTQEAATEIVAGDIGAAPKLTSVLTGHTLSAREQPASLDSIEFPGQVYQRAVYPRSKADVDKMTTSLSRIAEEDPSLHIDREPDTLEVLMGGLGDTHVEVAAEKIKRKFGVELDLTLPKVAYKETIASPATVEYKHKKQTGGHGQYGHVFLSLEPMPRGTEFEFASAVVGGSVPREYIPSVEKGVQKALSGGVVAGFPVVDLKATLVDGSFHSVDSSGMSFEIAGGHALSKALQAAGPVLLEPVMHISVTVPDEFTGEVAGDLNSKRARIQGMTPQGDGTTIVEGEVPLAEVLTYSTTLRSQTQGLGSFTIEFDHYEEVPAHLVERVVETLNEKEREEAKV